MSKRGDITDSQATLSGDGATVGDATEMGGEGTATGDGDAWVAMQIEPGMRMGDYELDHLLGAGGMGEVYAAHQLDGGRQVAIKFMSRMTPRLLYRFKREFRALADVSHRNVISLGELVVPTSGPAFFTMELVDGTPFVDYVRRRAEIGVLPNLVRLGRAVRQLVRGLEYLHEAGCIHRDIKPSNVLVTHEGRVVLLDFGLVSERDEEDGDSGISHDGQLLGTPAYMAPEQAALLDATPASDFYAVGVMLFECLTGVLPFRGSALEIVLRKQEHEPPDPCDYVSGVPPAVRELCIRLMSPEPEGRPNADEILNALSTRELGAGEDSRPSPVATRERRSRAAFVGRHTELRMLDNAFEDACTSRGAVTVHLSGASGLGKSALLERFVARLRATSDALILRGRCLERESVPYKGVDSIVDALSARLRRMLEDDRAGLQPRHVSALVQIFPVLSDVWPRENREARSASEGEVERYEPAELRRFGTAALREILSSLAQTRPLVIHIDDFQWSDVDGARLLTALVRPPDPPAVLLLVSYRGLRSEAIASSEAMRELTSAEACLGRDVRELELAPLPPAAATELAATLMGLDDEGSIEAREVARRRAEVVARRAGGNPFYIGQVLLDDSISTNTMGEGGDDRIVARRVVQLEPTARRVLATIAVSGGPTPLAVVREVHAELGSEALDQILETLVQQGLVSRRGREIESHDAGSSSSMSSGSLSGPSPAASLSSAPSYSSSSISGETLHNHGVVLEAAHARIREVTIAELETGELAGIHRALGQTLEQLGGDADTLAVHFEHAGELERALEYTEQAAAHASSALAFGRAVALYRRALTLLEGIESGGKRADPEHRRRLRLALAEQLINFGHSSEAGRLLRELAGEAETPTQSLALRREAAAQLLEAGHVGEGLELSAAVLHEVGEPPPRGFWASLWGFLFGRLRLRIRGLGYREQPESAIPAERLQLFDTLWLINRGLTLHLEMHSFVLHNRLVRLALELGEPRRLGKMLANEMLVVASSEGEGRVHAIVSEARELASRVRDPELDRLIDMQGSMVEYALNRFRESTDQLRELLLRLDDAAGVEWLRLTATLVYSSLCVITGRWGELYRNLPQWLAAARERGNLREIVELEAYAAMTELHRGQLERARYHLDNGRAMWDASSYNYTSVMLDRVEIFILLGEQEFDRVVTRVDEMLASVKRSSVAFNPVVQRFVDQLIGRSWAVAAVHAPTDTRLHARLRKVCKRLRRTKVPLYVGEAALCEAALLSITGDELGLRKRWREAELLFDQSGIECQLAAVRWQLAQLTTGEESRGFTRAADKYFVANGIRDAAAIADILAPRVRAAP